MKPTVHYIIICYENAHQTAMRYQRDIAPGLKQTGLPYVSTCIDNSQNESIQLAELFGNSYLWQNGNNLQYGPSLNLAINRVDSDFMLYTCSKHGKMLDDTWIIDMLNPMLYDSKVGIVGHLMGSNSPGGVADHGKHNWVKERYYFEDGVPQHVQGGVFAARTDLMQKYPYPNDYPHLYTDHLITWEMLRNGHKVADVPTIKSVWKDFIHNRNSFKYIHDNSEDR